MTQKLENTDSLRRTVIVTAIIAFRARPSLNCALLGKTPTFPGNSAISDSSRDGQRRHAHHMQSEQRCMGGAGQGWKEGRGQPSPTSRHTYFLGDRTFMHTSSSVPRAYIQKCNFPCCRCSLIHGHSRPISSIES